MKDKKLTFDEVWELAELLGLPLMNCGPGETEKEGITIHQRIGRNGLFTRTLGDQVVGFSLERFLICAMEWSKAVGKQEGERYIKNQFKVLLEI